MQQAAENGFGETDIQETWEKKPLAVPADLRGISVTLI